MKVVCGGHLEASNYSFEHSVGCSFRQPAYSDCITVESIARQSLSGRHPDSCVFAN